MNHTIKTDIETVDTLEMLFETVIEQINKGFNYDAIKTSKKGLALVRLIQKENSNWLTLEIASLKLNCTARTVRRMYDDGRLKGVVKKHKLFIFESSIDDYFKKIEEERGNENEHESL